MAIAEKQVVLSIRDLTVNYKTRAGEASAVDHVSLDLYKGEVLGLVGESGCGKSTLGKALLRMIRPPGYIASGQIIFDGEDIMTYKPRRMRHIRGERISMIFQDPMTSLNPVQRIDNHIVEAIQVHKPEVSRKEAVERARELMERLAIGRNRLKDYPHQLSGGMRQRMMISLALALKADIIIADEPTTSLDVIVEAQFIEMLRELQRELNLTMVLISHNIGLVSEMADRIAVMYAGRMAEVADAVSLFNHTYHPYTQGLLKSVPNIADNQTELYRMEGSLPSLHNQPKGCRFHPRCPQVMDICQERTPGLLHVAEEGAPPPSDPRDRHLTACWLYEEH